MAFKLVVFSCLLAAAYGSVGPYAAAPIAYNAPVQVAARLEEFDPRPQYRFGYDVADSLTGDYKSQTEERNGDFVQGQYSLVESDGTRRVVDYTADSVNGFNAMVRNEPLVAAAPAAIAEPAVVAARYATPVAAPVIAQPAFAPARYTAAPAGSNFPYIARYATAPVAAPVVAARYATAPVSAPIVAARYAATPVAAAYTNAPVAARYATAPVATAVAAPVAARYAAAPVAAAYTQYAPAAYTQYAPAAYTQYAPAAYTQYAPTAYAASYTAAAPLAAYTPYASPVAAAYTAPFAAAYTAGVAPAPTAVIPTRAAPAKIVEANAAGYRYP